MPRTSFAILLLWSISSSALAGIEVGQLIRSALLEQKNGYLPWSFYAQPDSPVEWQTNGIAGFKRDGKVILAVAGPGGHFKFPHLWPGQIPPGRTTGKVGLLLGMGTLGKAAGGFFEAIALSAKLDQHTAVQ